VSKQIDTRLFNFTGAPVNWDVNSWVIYVVSGEHDRIIRLTDRSKSAKLKLLSAMFNVKHTETNAMAAYSLRV